MVLLQLPARHFMSVAVVVSFCIQSDCRDVHAHVPTLVVWEEEGNDKRRLKLWEGQTKEYSEVSWRKLPDGNNGRGR